MSRTPRPAAFWSRICFHTNSIAPTSNPRVGWAAIRSLGSVSSSLARISFCWLPPDSVEAVTSTLRARMSNSFTSRVARSYLLDEQHPERPGEIGVVLSAEHRVLPERHVQDQALVVAVLWDVPHAGVPDAEHRPASDRVPLELDRSRLGGAEPDQRLRELALPVALNAHDAED